MEYSGTSGIPEEKVLSRAELRALGVSARQITRSVRDGTITRVRRDHYLLTAEHDSVVKAVRVGGRLTCVSAIALASTDVFVFATDHVHVHAGRDRSRLRAADGSPQRWSKTNAHGVRVGWGDLTEPPAGRHLVALVDAVRTLIRCVPEREAIATLDSMARLGLVTIAQVREVLSSLPGRHRRILGLLDPRAESGPETFMRLILWEIGVPFDVQVRISGVGRVDFLVDGFLIIECDSKSFHEGWEKQRDDRRRDRAAAARGLFTLRVLAEDLLYHPQRVADAVRELLVARDAWTGR